MKHKSGKIRYPYWFCIPAAAVYGVFFVVPIIIAFVMSFTDWHINDMWSAAFYGLRNYKLLLQDEVFVRSLVNTFIYALSTAAGKAVVGLGLALLVSRPRFGNNFFRTLFYLPCVLSSVVVGLLFKSILGLDGLLNHLLNFFGASSVDWLGNYGTAMACIIFLEIWMWGGFSMFIYISGLQAISNDYYECAQLEGANKWQQFTKITLPLLMPSITVVLTLGLTGGFRVFDTVYILTNGGPGFDTQVLNTYTYRAFGMGFLGQSCASAVILSLIVVIFAFTVNHTLKKREVEV